MAPGIELLVVIPEPGIVMSGVMTFLVIIFVMVEILAPHVTARREKRDARISARLSTVKSRRDS